MASFGRMGPVGGVMPSPERCVAPPDLKYVFFGCDDTLYQNDFKTSDRISKRIGAFAGELGVGSDRLRRLEAEWGGPLQALLIECLMPRDMIEEYFESVYAVDLKEVAPDPTLKKVVEHCRSAADRYVFTASPREHAERCLKRLGLRGLFNSIVDVRCCELNTKHASRSFDRAMLAAGCGDGRECVLVDDDVRNIAQAKLEGFTTILVGVVDRKTGDRRRCDDADYHVASVHDLPRALPTLFPPHFPPIDRPKPAPPDPYPRLEG